jgi:hypothetical protein
MIVVRSMEILGEFCTVWPITSRWLHSLEKFRDQKNNLKLTSVKSEGSMDDSVSLPHLNTAYPLLGLP